MCILRSVPGACEHAECNSVSPPLYVPAVLDPWQHLAITMTQISHIFAQIMENNQKIPQLLVSLETFTQRSEAIAKVKTKVTPLPADLRELIFAPDSQEFQFNLHLVSDAPVQVFKERGFSLTLQVRNRDDSPAKVLAGSKFKILLYTQDSPPKPVILNISGRKILRGTVEAECGKDGIVCFSNIVINEVSSHYINDSFFLAVLHAGRADVKPYLQSEMSVRARKPMKRATRNNGCDFPVSSSD